MPQMSPLMWLTLFMLFSLLLISAMIKIYFMNNKSIKLNETPAMGEKNNNKIWQW
uniref:ATP synthase F0 subunit 8 n=1 Tax=Orchesella villosa TaxID=48706 RepID=B2BSC8_ORCVL|nr:ATP synthase F0 subunit 8 [Orchesella villosa]ABS57581.1 ATP synthase F0 subunit 8 [Orchesella villosa]